MKILQNFTEEHSEHKEKRKGGREKEKRMKILETVPVPKSEV